MPLKSVTPQAARQLLEQGALLVDVRASDEHAREHIAQARHMPLKELARGTVRVGGAPAVIFHCRSGQRTRMHAHMLASCTDGRACVLEGGLDAWKRAGLPVVRDARQPLELQRQVQIAAGTLVLAGTVLGAAVSPAFYVVPGFVGGGLVWAGLTGFCGMARVLMQMPWNRRAVGD